MEYDHERAKEKKEEINKLTKEAILKYWNGLGVKAEELDTKDAAEEIINNFVEIDPPEKEVSVYLELMTFRSGGRGGGRSVKPGNIFLNFRKLISFLASCVLTGASMVHSPWTAPFAAVVLWDRLWSNLNLELSEREAAIIWTLWLYRDKNDCVPDSGLLEKINSELNKFGRSSISQEELNDSLSKLKEMECIEAWSQDPSKWWLCEWVKVTYR